LEGVLLRLAPPPPGEPGSWLPGLQVEGYLSFEQIINLSSQNESHARVRQRRGSPACPSCTSCCEGVAEVYSERRQRCWILICRSSSSLPSRGRTKASSNQSWLLRGAVFWSPPEWASSTPSFFPGMDGSLSAQSRQAFGRMGVDRRHELAIREVRIHGHVLSEYCPPEQLPLTHSVSSRLRGCRCGFPDSTPDFRSSILSESVKKAARPRISLHSIRVVAAPQGSRIQEWGNALGKSSVPQPWEISIVVMPRMSRASGDSPTPRRDADL